MCPAWHNASRQRLDDLVLGGARHGAGGWDDSISNIHHAHEIGGDRRDHQHVKLLFGRFPGAIGYLRLQNALWPEDHGDGTVAVDACRLVDKDNSYSAVSVIFRPQSI